jgi:hypothetical protein
MTRVMCSPWKMTFTLAPMTPLTMVLRTSKEKQIFEILLRNELHVSPTSQP